MNTPSISADVHSLKQADARPPKDHRASQIRGVLAERVVVSTTLDPFLPLRALAEYSGLSVRTLRHLIDLSPDEALPCYRLPGKVLVRKSDFDSWLQRYKACGRPNLTRAIVELGLEAP